MAEDWENLIEIESHKDYFIKLNKFIDEEYSFYDVYPMREDIYRAMSLTPYDLTKVVILGQDPYHAEGQANGLAFSVPDGIEFPPSLRNIFKELVSDMGISPPIIGDLSCWAKQGVLLINATLTVRIHCPNSHSNCGWGNLTDNIISHLSKCKENLVFILWGKNARSKKSLVDTSKHLVIESVHPSPLSAYRGFFGSKPFSRTNEYLSKCGKEPIDWQVK